MCIRILNSRFLVCLITGHTGGKVNNLHKSFRNQLWPVFSCHMHLTLTLYYLDVYGTVLWYGVWLYIIFATFIKFARALNRTRNNFKPVLDRLQTVSMMQSLPSLKISLLIGHPPGPVLENNFRTKLECLSLISFSSKVYCLRVRPGACLRMEHLKCVSLQ